MHLRILTYGFRFDGRMIRVDKASDTGPRSGFPTMDRAAVAAYGMAPAGYPAVAYGSAVPRAEYPVNNVQYHMQQPQPYMAMPQGNSHKMRFG